MHNPKGADEVPDLVAYRIAMNFGSHAQNPFLMTLDGIKKVNLHTDGLGQSVLLKGYGSEGHDSGHLDYANVGERIGGVADFKTLIKEAQPYGAKLGIHVNASETYPESKYFSEERLMRAGNGAYSYGWNWIDQGININAAYDLAHGRRQRFQDLKDVLGDGLDFIYVDVWGNGQSGDNSAWATHQLAKEINAIGSRAAFEWGYAGEYDSTFQHWAADINYGGYGLKGINSSVARFIRNHQKDSWVANIPRFGGAAYYPLFFGYDMQDFEGWQGRSNYRSYIQNLFKNNVPTKFIQHFQTYRIAYGDEVSFSDNNENYKWRPEMELEFRNAAGDKLLVKRASNDVQNNNYRERTMTLNGKTIYQNNSYLLPWSWDANGKPLADESKYYYYNEAATSTTWQIKAEDAGKTFHVYKLTDLGPVSVKDVVAEQGQITLDLDPNTPYVISTAVKSANRIEYGTGEAVKDPGFNSGSLDAWTKLGNESDAIIERSQGDNPMLTFNNSTEKLELTQSLRNLQANTTYALSVGVDNRSTEPLVVKVQQGDKVNQVTVTKSIAKNYIKAYAHNTLEKNATVANVSYFQNAYVFFTTGSDVSDVKLVFSRSAGAGKTYIDDIRVAKNDSKNFNGMHDTANSVTDLNEQTKIVFEQDFESVMSGIYPFVISDVEYVEDNRQHLAEYHSPYTQRGWNGKVISDVIAGKWSLKTNGLIGRNKLLYQTIPQNFTFKPGKTYKVSFDYEAGSNNTYAFVVGHSEYQNVNSLEKHYLGNTWENSENAKRVSFVVEGNASGQTFIGIMSGTNAADTKNAVTDGEKNFRSYRDFVMDNLRIEEVETTAELLITERLKRTNKYDPNKYTQASLNAYKDKIYALYKAQAKMSTMTEAEARALIKEVDDAENSLVKRKLYVEAGDISKLEANQNSDGESFAKAFDNDTSTIWHTNWYSTQVSTPAVITLKKAMKLKSLTYLPRTDGPNGRLKSGTVKLKLADGTEKEFTFKNFANDAKAKTIPFNAELEVQTVTIIGKESYGNGANNQFASAAEIHLDLVVSPEQKVDPSQVKEMKDKLEKYKKHKDVFAVLGAINYVEEYDLWTDAQIASLMDAANSLDLAKIEEELKAGSSGSDVVPDTSSKILQVYTNNESEVNEIDLVPRVKVGRVAKTGEKLHTVHFLGILAIVIGLLSTRLLQHK